MTRLRLIVVLVLALAVVGVVIVAARPWPEVPAAGPRAQPADHPRPEAPRTTTVVMGGDLLWHDTVWASARADHARTGAGGGGFDFDPMFAAIRPLVRSADVALCHEEVPFAPPGRPLRSYPLFAAPPEVAPWLASMGFDGCTTASNHALDQGWEGLEHTATLLDRAGVAHVGTFRTPAERLRPVLLRAANGVRVGIVAGTFGLNGLPLPQGREWSVSLGDADDLLAQARRARQAGADIVVVNFHGGTEYDGLPNAEQQAIVERLTRSADVDLVLGEHAHVVQPITRVNGTWVVYGMGNLVAQQEVTRPDTYRGIMVRFTFAEQPGGGFEVSRAAYLPVAWNAVTPDRPIRVRPASPGPDRDAVREAVDSLGHEPGLVELRPAE